MILNSWAPVTTDNSGISIAKYRRAETRRSASRVQDAKVQYKHITPEELDSFEAENKDHECRLEEMCSTRNMTLAELRFVLAGL